MLVLDAFGQQMLECSVRPRRSWADPSSCRTANIEQGDQQLTRNGAGSCDHAMWPILDRNYRCRHTGRTIPVAAVLTSALMTAAPLRASPKRRVASRGQALQGDFRFDKRPI